MNEPERLNTCLHCGEYFFSEAPRTFCSIPCHIDWEKWFAETNRQLAKERLEETGGEA